MKLTQEAKDQITRNNQRIASLSLGVKAIGKLLYSVDDNIGLSDDVRCETGYLLDAIGEIMLETLNDSTHIEINSQLKSEERKQ